MRFIYHERKFFLNSKKGATNTHIRIFRPCFSDYAILIRGVEHGNVEHGGKDSYNHIMYQF